MYVIVWKRAYGGSKREKVVIRRIRTEKRLHELGRRVDRKERTSLHNFVFPKEIVTICVSITIINGRK